MSYRTNSKYVIDKVDEHIKSFYESEADLIADWNAVAQKGASLVEGGSFLISYYDQRQFLDSLNLNNNSGREFSDQEVFDPYKLLLTRGIQVIARNALSGVTN